MSFCFFFFLNSFRVNSLKNEYLPKLQVTVKRNNMELFFYSKEKSQWVADN